MCGRYTISRDQALLEEELKRRFPALHVPDSLIPRYNVAPTQAVPILRAGHEGHEKEIALVRWGLIPSWAKDEKLSHSMINARADALTQKPAFREAVRRRRCLVIADGFYEWRTGPDGKKRPIRFVYRDGALMFFAGLWERWLNPATQQIVESCTIVTTAPNNLVAQVHDRMPVILDEERQAAWLSNEPLSQSAIDALCTAVPDDAISAHPASTLVNSPKNDHPDLLQADPAPGELPFTYR